MGRYRKDEFLEYYDFKDVPESVPQIFHRYQKSYVELIDKVKEDVKIGVKLKDAIRLNAGVTPQIVNKWARDFTKEIEDGKTDTPLIRLFMAGIKSDAELYRKVMKMAMDKAEDGDAETIRFLAKNRLGYGRPLGTNVNVDNSENNNIQITITDMKEIDTIDVKGEAIEETKELEAKDD